jgi:hypothetical protein
MNTTIALNTGAEKTDTEKGAKLPRRDWILLPAVSLMTVVLLGAPPTIVAHYAGFVEKGSLLPCLVRDDSSTGVRGIPGSVCWEQGSEDSDPVEYRFNSSGYRSDVPFLPKQKDTYRIVVLGSSVAIGMHVPVERTFAQLLPAELSRRTGHKAEVYNEGIQTGFPRRVSLNFKDVLTVQPDLVLWVLTERDVEWSSELIPGTALKASQQRDSAPASPKGFLSNLVLDLAKLSPLDAMRKRWESSRLADILRHYLYRSQSLYLASSLMPGAENDYPRAVQSSDWQEKLAQFEIDAAEIESKARAAHIPLVAAYCPNRTPAAMVSAGKWPGDYNPYKLDDQLRSIITSHGGTYIDILPDFHEIPNPEQGYLPLDGHPDARGHAIIAAFLAKKLTNGAVPALMTAPGSRPN